MGPTSPPVGIDRIEVSEDLLDLMTRLSSPIGPSVDPEANSTLEKALDDSFRGLLSIAPE
jgi:hypothetical protein